MLDARLALITHMLGFATFSDADDEGVVGCARGGRAPNSNSIAPVSTEPHSANISWTLHMASIIIFGTLLGVYLSEWKGVSKRTHWFMRLGLFVLVSSTVVIGYGNYLAKEATSSAKLSSK